MGSIAIIGLGKGYDRNPAPLKSYTDLYSLLGGQSGRTSLTSRFVIINAASETLPYSTQLHTNFSPAQVADHINKGGVWIDYTGWPMYYQADAQGTITTLGQAGWAQFVNDLGPAPAHYGWLSKVGFAVPLGTIHGFSTQYPFVRGFPLNESLDGVCYSTTSFSEPGRLGTYPASASGFASMIAIHVPNAGYYFYATGTPLRDVILNGDSQGVPIQTYANFIQQVLSGNMSGLTCQPYKTNYQKPAPTSTGQASPTTISTSPGPSGSGSGGSLSISTTTTTTRPTTSSGGSGSGSVSTSTQAHCAPGYHYAGGHCVPDTTTTPASTGSASKWLIPGLLVAVAAGGVYYAGNQEGWWGSNGQSNQPQ